MKKKYLYFLFLFIICLLGSVLVPTYAKFTENFTVDEDVVGFNFNFNLEISNIEEYEEVNISPNDTEIFNVEIKNNIDSTSYYGIWYKMVNPSEKTDDITIARLEKVDIPTSGSINANESITTTIIIVNNTSSEIKINIGIASSDTSVTDIEYLGGKKLISGTAIKPTINGTLLSSYIQNLYNDGNEITNINIGDKKDKPSISLNKNQNILLDNNNEYRYYGANPNNYIKYNDELWRIISISNTKNENSDIEKKVKIIKESSIGNFSYDNNSNNWSNSNIMMLLNPGYEENNDDNYEKSLYWNSKIGACYENLIAKNCDFTIDSATKGLNADAKKMISKTQFYLGSNITQDYSDLYPSDFYTIERGIVTYDNNPATWTGYIGLIYLSDYGYATDLSICKETMDNYANNSDCINNNWLFDSNNNQWTITPTSFENNTVIGINGVGNFSVIDINNSSSIRPTLYLNSNIIITGGDGTKENPYTLSM